jgi:nitrogen-specific signal transduction histidine kinase/CheY-like chemotaxis protein
MFDAGGGLRGFRGVAHDVTDRLREEAEVQQARRVESLGVLAGGIAHDFNNLLTAILGNAELALAELPESGAVRPLVAQIQAAGQHAAQLTHQMLAYAGRGRLEIQRVDITSAVRDMAQLLAASIPKKVELVLDLAEDPPAVEADPAQVRQVVMNLVLNAAEAIGEREGRIDLRTFTGDAARHFQPDFTLGKMAAGRTPVCFEIADSGSGIAREELPKVFDPFFTTKFAGRGLGLAAVHGIALRHGGTISVRSTPGAGAAFLVCFPAADGAPHVAAPPARAPASAPATPPAPAAAAAALGGGTILLVDDEAPVRAMATRMVQALGFRVLTAADGREAVAIAAGAPELRAVLLDLTMPHMDGRETIRELRRLRPDLPVVLCSGYDVLESAGRFTDLAFSAFLQKPFRLDDLAKALRHALGA